jgi:hypothetical protein
VTVITSKTETSHSCARQKFKDLRFFPLFKLIETIDKNNSSGLFQH